MSEASPLSLIEVSPLVLWNVGGSDSDHCEKHRESISSPFVKLNLYSRSLRVIWDKHSESCRDDEKKNVRIFETSQGTAYVCDNAHSRMDRAGEKEALIEKVETDLLRRDAELRKTYYGKETSWSTPHEIARARKTVLPIVIIPSEDPSDVNGIPCLIRVYSSFRQARIPSCSRKRNISADVAIEIVDGSIVQILPPIIATAIDTKLQICCVSMQSNIASEVSICRPKRALKFTSAFSLEDSFLGLSELKNGRKEAANDAHVFSRFESETIKSLTFRMKALLCNHIFIGTTKDALYHRQKSKQRLNRLYKATTKYWGANMSNMLDIQDESRSSLTSVAETASKSKRVHNDFCYCGALTVHDPIQGSGKSALVTAIARSILKCQAIHVVNGSVFFAKYGSNCADAALESILHQIVMRTAVKESVGGEIGSVCIILDHLDTFVPSILGGRGDPSSSALSANSAYLSKLAYSIATKKYFPFPLKNPFYNVKGKDGFLFPVKVCIVGIMTCDDSGARKLGMNGTSYRNILDVFGTNSRYRLQTPTNVPKEKRKCSESGKKLYEAVGGNNDAKKAFEDVLAIDERKKFILSKFGLSLPTGILLYGPPGTGKTLLARALASSMNANAKIPATNKDREITKGAFISIKASDIICSEVGRSEKLLSSLFETARKRSPSVVFIDEFQALFTSRDKEDGTSGKGSGRLASTLLTLMDDITQWQEANLSAENVTGNHFLENRVVLLAATNTPWMVDRAFLRSGRFDRVVHVGLPTLSERESILRVHINNMKINPAISDDIAKRMAHDCEGFSGADLSQLVRAAAARCMMISPSSQVEMQHFIDAKKYDITDSSSEENLVCRLKRWRP